MREKIQYRKMKSNTFENLISIQNNNNLKRINSEEINNNFCILVLNL